MKYQSLENDCKDDIYKTIKLIIVKFYIYHREGGNG